MLGEFINYYRPIPIDDPVVAAAMREQDQGYALAGGWTTFRHVQHIKRSRTDWKCQYELVDPDVDEVDEELDEALTTLTKPRRPFAGVDMRRPALMGVVNVTPDSFSDGGQFATPAAAVAQGERLVDAGASIIDFGGESTRPGATPVPEEEELDRVLPAIEAFVRARPGVPVSVDTRHLSVAKAALAAGAVIVNDVSGMQDGASKAFMIQAVEQAGASIIFMHAHGDPETMQDEPTYKDVLVDVYHWLSAIVAIANITPLGSDCVAVDPGIGFGKTLEQNLALLRGLAMFHGIGCPVVLGCSRKGFIGALSGEDDPAARMPGSIAAALRGASCGVQILRVHDVAETAQALAVWMPMARSTRP